MNQYDEHEKRVEPNIQSIADEESRLSATNEGEEQEGKANTKLLKTVGEVTFISILFVALQYILFCFSTAFPSNRLQTAPMAFITSILLESMLAVAYIVFLNRKIDRLWVRITVAAVAFGLPVVIVSFVGFYQMSFAWVGI